MKLIEKLVGYGVNYSVSKGVVTLEALPDNLDSLCGTDGTVNDKEFSDFLDELNTYTTYIDAHPEGSDRGGYVVWVEHGNEKCFYYEPSCEWCVG